MKTEKTIENKPVNIKPVYSVIDAETAGKVFDWQEFWRYRELFYFLVWRDIKTRYAQSVLGIGWAIIQPVFNMVVFTIVFENLAKVSSDGVPYAIFSYTALVPWTYFAGALTSSSGSLLSSARMLTKVYFPRLVIPIDPLYLCWKMKSFNYNAHFIELASEINANMPRYTVGRVMDAMNEHDKALKGSKCLVLGVAYKPDTDDIRVGCDWPVAREGSQGLWHEASKLDALSYLVMLANRIDLSLRGVRG